MFLELYVALTLFWFPGVCPLRLEYFHIPQKDYGFLFLFSLFNFQGPVRSIFFCQALDYFITSFDVCHADMRMLYSLSDGDEITFRIINDSIEFLDSDVEKVDVVSLRYDGYEILSLDDVIENIESGMIEVRIVLPIVFAVFTALAVLGYVIYARRTFVNNHLN